MSNIVTKIRINENQINDFKFIKPENWDGSIKSLIKEEQVFKTFELLNENDEILKTVKYQGDITEEFILAKTGIVFGVTKIN